MPGDQTTAQTIISSGARNASANASALGLPQDHHHHPNIPSTPKPTRPSSLLLSFRLSPPSFSIRRQATLNQWRHPLAALIKDLTPHRHWHRGQLLKIPPRPTQKYPMPLPLDLISPIYASSDLSVDPLATLFALVVTALTSDVPRLSPSAYSFILNSCQTHSHRSTACYARTFQVSAVSLHWMTLSSSLRFAMKFSLPLPFPYLPPLHTVSDSLCRYRTRLYLN